jgi:hypothetical protein
MTDLDLWLMWQRDADRCYRECFALLMQAATPTHADDGERVPRGATLH